MQQMRLNLYPYRMHLSRHIIEYSYWIMTCNHFNEAGLVKPGFFYVQCQTRRNDIENSIAKTTKGLLL